MPDRLLSRQAQRRLAQFEVATDVQRFRLLAHAATHRDFLSTDAEPIARGAKSNSGTARTNHAPRLVGAGLLRRRENPVRYEITKDGRFVYDTLRTALRDQTAARRSEETVIFVSVGRLSGGGESDPRAVVDDLAATLERELRNVAGSVRRAGG